MNEFEEEPSFEEGSVEYDLRDYERASFGRAYRRLNEMESRMFAQKTENLKQQPFKQYISQARVILKITRRYAQDKEIKNTAKEMEEKMATELGNMNKINGYLPSMELIENLRETIEDLRHDANLRLPRKKEGDPRQAWREH